MTAETAGRPRTYGGWQRERVAFLFGLSAARAALLLGSAMAAVIPFAAASARSGALLWPAAAVLAAAALVRVRGRTGDEWAAGVLSWMLIRARGQHRFAGGPFALAQTSGRRAAGEEPQLDLPGILAPLRLLSVPAGPRDLVVVESRHDRTWTAVAQVRFPGIGLSDSARREQRLAGWGALLASLCTEGGPLVRVQALQRLVPESGAALRSWHAGHLAPGAPDFAVSVAGELLATATLTTTRREAFLAFTMDARRARAQVRAAGGGDQGAAAVLVRHLRGLHQALGAADLTVEDWLGARDLAEVIRAAYDPHSQHLLAARRAAAGRAADRGAAAGTPPAGVSPDLAGPVYAEAWPGAYLHDGAVSVSYWVHSWPGEAYCTALGPLLGDGGHRRSLSVVYEPLGPRAAEKAVMRERTARHVAVRMRQRTGQVVPEHERAAVDRALGQDAERAAGHGLVRFAGYATVTADAETIEDACAGLEADAAAARIELRRLWFAQDSGFALGALPLGLGLPKRRW